MFRSCAIGTALLLAACARGGAGTSLHGGTVRAYLPAEPASLSLIGKTDLWSEIIAYQITDSLVQYDSRLELVPRVAASWEFSPDRLTLTFHLRDGVRWHDGTPVTADDVVFTVERVRDPRLENRTFGGLFQDLTGIEALDARTLRVRYQRATPDVLESWRVPLVPAHLARGDDLLTGSFQEQPVGCGPFRFARRVRGEEIELVANDDYWDGPPGLRRLVFRQFADERTAWQALMRGELDLMTPISNSLRPDAATAVASGRWIEHSAPSLSLWQIGWNQDGSNPFFTDARVRRAMVLALDREAFIAHVVPGVARRGITSYHPDSSWADPAVEPWPYDAAEAGRLLDAAGWRDRDGDGVRERDGHPFRFTLLVPSSTQPLNEHMAQWQQQCWAKIGVRADILKLEWQAFREQRGRHEFQAAAATFKLTPNPDQFELYHSSMREHGFNFVGLADAEIDRLLEQGRTTFDRSSRLEIYRRLQHRLHELEPISVLFYFTGSVLHDRQLEGVQPTPLDCWQTTAGPRQWHWVANAGP
ncbi:MAG TPA: ABC transporter substrate-binding protein [Candidatus Polarisedimenticolaceae bacterium]|nr:ABC transporter substrate-binding protein [Candidatus Polarisedimenticolaceae bacterium]